MTPETQADNVVIFIPSIKFIAAVYLVEIVAGFLILLYLLSRARPEQI